MLDEFGLIPLSLLTVIHLQHALSLPFFVPFLSNMSSDLAVINNTPPTIFRIPMPPGVLPDKYPGTPTSNVLAVGIPSAWIAFAMNIFTQGLCINGVNRLTSVRWTRAPELCISLTRSLLSLP